MKLITAFVGAIAIFALFGLNTISQAVPAGYKLVWSDEFNGPVGSLPNPKIWNYDDGQGYNDELEFNKVSPASCAIVSDPTATDHKALEITASPSGAGKYTSARINTKAKYSTQFGYVVARMKIPYGNGVWPAFWMMGANADQVGWPKCGEVDIMENIGKEPGTVHGSIHGPNYTGGAGVGTPYSLPNNQALADSYHTYAIDWKPGKMVFYLDNTVYATYTPTSLPTGCTWCFDSQPFYLILNLAIGGSWPGSPDGSTPFPSHLLVDYVRVYKSPS